LELDACDAVGVGDLVEDQEHVVDVESTEHVGILGRAGVADKPEPNLDVLAADLERRQCKGARGPAVAATSFPCRPVIARFAIGASELSASRMRTDPESPAESVSISCRKVRVAEAATGIEMLGDVRVTSVFSV
jgi:hypothetical protein